MQTFKLVATVAATILLASGSAQAMQAGARAETAQIVLPVDTIIQITTVQEITSINMKEGDRHTLQVATDVSENGVVIIPRGSPVHATVTWRTGKGIGGKSAKFELTFNSVTVRGQQYALRGTHRQEGRGNTAAALLGSMVISGRSATIQPGQTLNAFTAEAITAR
jgi:hypothetical protein